MGSRKLGVFIISSSNPSSPPFVISFFVSVFFFFIFSPSSYSLLISLALLVFRYPSSSFSSRCRKIVGVGKFKNAQIRPALRAELLAAKKKGGRVKRNGNTGETRKIEKLNNLMVEINEHSETISSNSFYKYSLDTECRIAD